ncbi:MAG: type IV pilin [Candidatus Thermoplasmatota archaeon]|nr:type IV pilin [Candidatus Thermoplasmatota archaeon]
MKRLNRKEEAVSPVIATILMVAITVVLAATLYMMVGDFGGEGGSPVAGDIEHYEDATFRFVSLETPSSAEPADLEITVIYDGTEYAMDGDSNVDAWSVLSDGEVAASSRFNVSALENNDGDADNIAQDWTTFDEDLLEEVIIRIDGYSGTIEWAA